MARTIWSRTSKASFTVYPGDDVEYFATWWPWQPGRFTIAMTERANPGTTRRSARGASVAGARGERRKGSNPGLRGDALTLEIDHTQIGDTSCILATEDSL
jgi:hypothetical protein